MKLESFHTSEDKRRHKIVITQDYRDLKEPYEIEYAYEETGEIKISVPKPDGDGFETKTLSFGAHGIRIVKRGR